MTKKPAKTDDSTLSEGFSASLTIDSLNDVARAADMIYKSGAFGGLNNAQEAGAKIMAGLELGLSPMTSVRNIYFFDGSVTLSGPILAALIREHPKYDYQIMGSNREGAKVRFFRRKQTEDGVKWDVQGDVVFTEKMAKAANLLSKDNWQKYPEDMYVWRCIARGKRWYCPEVANGTIYLPDEARHGTAEDVEPVEETVRHEGPEDADVEILDAEEEKHEEEKPEEGGEEQPETPDHTGKEESAPSTKPGGPASPPEPPEKAAEDTKDRKKPIPTDEDGEYKPPGPPEKQAPGEEGEATEKPEPDAPTSQMEPEEDRKGALVPSYISANPAALTKEAAKKIQAIHETLRSMKPGNSLLTSVKSYREEIREEYPNAEDVDRVALEEVLDHHIERIGTGPEEEEGEEEEPEGLGELDAPETPEAFDFSWLDSIGRKFRNDMEKSAKVLSDAMNKKGITPLETRLSELRNRFEDAGTTPEMEDEFEKVLRPYQTVLSMREALMGGQTPQIEVFNRAVNDFMEKTEDWTNSRRVNRARELVTREARRLASEFEDLSIEINEEEPDAPKEASAEGPTTGENGRSDSEGVSDRSEENGGEGGTGKRMAPDIPLPPGFPKKDKLTGAGIKRTGVVMDKMEDGSLTDVKGVGPASVEKMKDYLSEIAG